MNAIPCSADARWAAWARPLAAFLRVYPSSRDDCAEFGLRAIPEADAELAANLLPWLENEGFVEVTDEGIAVLTPAGLAWTADAEVVVPSFRRLRHVARPPRAPDIREETFERLRPVRRDGRAPDGGAIWLCECSCGNPELVRVKASHLRSHHTRSCGCLIEEFRKSGRPASQWRAA